MALLLFRELMEDRRLPRDRVFDYLLRDAEDKSVKKGAEAQLVELYYNALQVRVRSVIAPAATPSTIPATTNFLTRCPMTVTNNV